MGHARSAAQWLSKGYSMTTSNRQRKSQNGNEDNPPGLVHVNELSISDNSNADKVNRTRKSACSENAVIGCSSDTAFNWLFRSGRASFVPGLLDARQPSQQPPGEASVVLRTSSSQVPIHGSNPTPELFQSSSLGCWRVRRMQLVRPPFCGNQFAESDLLSGAIKSSKSHRSTSKIYPYALVNGSFWWMFMALPEIGVAGCLLTFKSGYK